MKLTKRDKKLLIFLVLFLVFFGDGLLIVRPILAENRRLESEIEAAEVQKRINEEKARTAKALEDRKEQAAEELKEEQKDFYEWMPSSSVDKLLTEMALSHGLEVNTLEITMPETGKYMKLRAYGADGTVSAKDEGTQFEGIYCVNASMTMTGSRGDLQAMLDECAALEPKLRTAKFNWKENRETVRRKRTYEEAVKAAALEAAARKASSGQAAEEAAPEETGQAAGELVSGETGQAAGKAASEGTEQDDRISAERVQELMEETIQDEIRNYRLTVSFELYLYEDADTYISQRQEAAEAAKETEAQKAVVPAGGTAGIEAALNAGGAGF